MRASQQIILLGGPRKAGPAVPKIFVFAGQSNAQSNGTTTLAPPAYITVDSGVQLWDYDTSQFLTYHAAVNSLQPTTNNNGAADCWGPEAEFAYRYRQANPTETVYIVKYAIGSTGLFQGSSTPDWNPASTNQMFQNVQNAVSAAKAALVAQGKPTPVVPMVLWMQGEQDASNTTWANAYQANLTSFVSAVRSRWGDANTQIVAGLINYKWEGGAVQGQISTTVRSAQLAVSQASINVPLITRTDFYSLVASNHFDNVGCPEFGLDIWRKYKGIADTQYIPNGTFTVDTSGWTGITGGGPSGTVTPGALSASGGAMLITNATGATLAHAVAPLSGLTVGALYAVKFDITRNDNAGSRIRVVTDAAGYGNDLGGSGAVVAEASGAAQSGTGTNFGFGFIATAATLYLSFTNYSGATTGSLGVDNVSVTGP